MSNIFLIGFMGSGKTTIGRILSRDVGREFYDTDEAIVKKDGRKISRIFKESGEGYFRRLETMILKEMDPRDTKIVSCGGGMAIRKENVKIMKQLGKIIYLKATPQTILERVKKNNKRPILDGNKNIEFISELMNKRVPFYEDAADVEIDVNREGPTDISAKLKEYLT